MISSKNMKFWCNNNTIQYYVHCKRNEVKAISVHNIEFFVCLFAPCLFLFVLNTNHIPPSCCSLLLSPIYSLPLLFSSDCIEKGAGLPSATANHDSSNWGGTKPLPCIKTRQGNPTCRINFPKPAQVPGTGLPQTDQATKLAHTCIETRSVSHNLPSFWFRVRAFPWAQDSFICGFLHSWPRDSWLV